MLGYLLERLQERTPAGLVLLTTAQSDDDGVAALGAELGLTVIRSTAGDPLARLLAATEDREWQHVLRLRASRPLIDLDLAAALVEAHLECDASLSYTEHRAGAPWGMGSEVIAVEALSQLEAKALDPQQRETPLHYLRQNAAGFTVERFPLAGSDWYSFKLVLETEADLALLRTIAGDVRQPTVSAVCSYLEQRPALAHSNHATPPAEIGLEKLLLHPDKLTALTRADREPDLSYPVSIEVSLTNFCNIECVWCSDWDLRVRQGLKNKLDLATLTALFDDLLAGGTRGVVIEGGGEPTLHPDFAAIVRRLKEIGMSIGLITNGTRPLAPDVLAAFQWIRISLDASTTAEYYELKKRDLFEKVMANVRNYAAHCPTVGVGYVVTHNNMSDLESVVLRMRTWARRMSSCGRWSTTPTSPPRPPS